MLFKDNQYYWCVIEASYRMCLWLDMWTIAIIHGSYICKIQICSFNTALIDLLHSVLHGTITKCIVLSPLLKYSSTCMRCYIDQFKFWLRKSIVHVNIVTWCSIATYLFYSINFFLVLCHLIYFSFKQYEHWNNVI